jgi:DNA-binding transcriptional MerR regulator/effector-binding domain-containing protein
VKDWFTVGEISSLFNLNIQTLHYYDSIGLFSPVRKRGTKGERLYQFDQFYALASIRYLKKLGYPLKRIKESMDSRNPAFALEEMRSQSAELRRRCDELARIREAIDRKVRFVEEKTASLDPGSIELKDFPERRFIPLGLEEALYRNDDFYFYPTVVFYKGREKSFGAMLTGDAAEDESGPAPLAIAGGEYLVGYHRGPYEAMEASFARIRAAGAALGLLVSEEAVNVNIIDQFVERDARNYITEVQMRAVSR